jgi:HK97 family phage portal protein
MFLSNGTPVTGPIGTLADATPLFSTANYYGRTGLQLTAEFAAYAALYRTQVWVGTVVRKLARSTARLPFELGTTVAGGWEADTQSPAAQLLAKPNPRMDPFRFWLWIAAIKKIYGEAYILKLRDMDGVVRELHPMHPVNTIVHREDDGSLTYLYTAGIRQVGILPPIPEADVIPFVDFNPENAVRGLSVLESLRQTLLNEDAARRASASFWTRGARPAGALKHPGTLSRGAADRLKARMDSMHAGADHMGGTLVLEEGMDFVPIQLDFEDLQYIESRKLNREEVCSAYDVPPPVVHILDQATYSNITEQMRSQYRDTMAPDLIEYESVMQHHLLPDFPDSPDECRFDMDSVMRGDFESRATAVTGLVTSGVMKPKEGRKLFALGDAGPAADRLYANQAMQPLGTPVQGALPAGGGMPPLPGSTLPALPGSAPHDEYTQPAQQTQNGRQQAADGLRAVASLPVVRSILGRVSRCKSLGELRDRLATEHAAVLAPYFERQKATVLASLGTKALGTIPQDPVSGGGVGPFDARAWNDQLAALLQALAVATAKASGGKVAAQFNGGFNISEMAEWIRDNAAEAARRINATTLSQLITQLDTDADPAQAVAHVYDQLTTAEAAAAGQQPAPGVSAPGVVLAGAVVGGRLLGIARSRVQTVAQNAGQTAAVQAGATHKTWITGPNPRPEHGAVDGETVPVGDRFSNGLAYPGDPSEGPEESARCNCDLRYSREAS